MENVITIQVIFVFLTKENLLEINFAIINFDVEKCNAILCENQGNAKRGLPLQTNVKSRNFSKSRMTTRITSLSSSHEI